MPFITMSKSEQQRFQMVLGEAMGEVPATSDKAALMDLSGRLGRAKYPTKKKSD